MVDIRESAIAAAKIVHDAGGEIVGKTRIQKAAYFLECMGLGSGFDYYYKHYGPYSDDLTNALHYAKELGFTFEENRKAAWGGVYTIFRSAPHFDRSSVEARDRVLAIAQEANPVALELAATALFLKREGAENPWNEVRHLKPAKATSDNISLAKHLYKNLGRIASPKPLPQL